MSDVLTAEERALCDKMRRVHTNHGATGHEAAALAIIDRLCDQLAPLYGGTVPCEYDPEDPVSVMIVEHSRLTARLAAAERVAEAARALRLIQRQRDRDESEHCAAGMTYGQDWLIMAERVLDDALDEWDATSPPPPPRR